MSKFWTKGHFSNLVKKKGEDAVESLKISAPGAEIVEGKVNPKDLSWIK